jgi:hypothetical protein
MREGDEGPTTKVTGDGGLFQSVLHQLIADGEVKGSLRGGNAVYTPAVLFWNKLVQCSSYLKVLVLYNSTMSILNKAGSSLRCLQEHSEAVWRLSFRR